MKNKMIVIVCLVIFVSQTYLQAQSFRTQALSDRVQTLLVHSSAGWEVAPIIEMNKANRINIQFDVLGASPEYYTYSIIHCDADWVPSQLVTSEYLNGLQNNYIEDYENSFNTRMDYVNYFLSIPNEKVQLSVSGNYVVQVWDENENLMLNACFSVIDPQANIRMQASSLTDKGINSLYQAVSFEIDYGNDIRIPIQNLKVYVQQNNRFDNEAALVKPLNIQNRKAFYDHNPALIFEAGNEYRIVEMTTVLYNGLNVETVEYHAPYYHTILKPDIPRSNRSYTYYEDINGRIYIRNTNTDNPDTEADYEFVHFYIPCAQPLNENVYILSDAFHNLLDETSQMEYSPADKGYVKTALLKEGYYNYIYVTKKNNAYRASTAAIEGNYYETENEYRIWVYYRPLGGRYDQLIGIQTLQYR
jgi:hypothetical protein